VTLRSIVRADVYPDRDEVVHADIPCDGSTGQAVALSGHLFEGYIKQGANDNASGCAATLEMARALLKLVAEGKLPKPKRTIHLLWGQEISGTQAWLDKHPEIARTLIADLNFDMVGLGLAPNGSIWQMHRTPDTFPTVLNDVAQDVLETIAEVNRERIRHGGVSVPVVSQNGSRDPLSIKVERAFGGSDHAVFMGRGIPAVDFATWPDPFYHSSKDVPEHLDPTQFKRAAVVGLAAALVLANADDVGAARVVAESLARGAERMGAAQRKGLSYLADAADGSHLADAYNEARVAVTHQAGVEKGVIRSAAELFASPSEARKKLAAFEMLIDARASALLNEVTAYYKLQAQVRGVSEAEPVASELEQRAARLVVEPIAPTEGGAGVAGAAAQPMMAAMRKFPGFVAGELTALTGQNAWCRPRELSAKGGKKTVLEIRNFVSGEFEPVPLADVMAFVEAEAKAGVITLTEQSQPPRKPEPRRPSR
jgi:aminopeptidase YwaD